MSNRTRYKIDEIHKNTFYQLPKFIFEGEFENLSNDARVLYSILRDRHELSIKNNWVNGGGEVYLMFSREEMCDILKLSKKTVIKAIGDLKNYNLVDEEQQGLGKLNKIYLLTPASLDSMKSCKSYTSGSVKFTTQEVENLNPTVIEENQKKESFKNGVFADQSIRHQEAPKPRYDFTTTTEIIKDNIGYEDIIDSEMMETEMLDEIVHVIVSTICSEYKDGYISMGEQKIYAEVVKSTFFKLKYEDIEYFNNCFNQQTNPIVKLSSYIRTSLFRNYGTIEHNITNVVHVTQPQLARKKVKSKNE
jgi:hypothetical protein